MTKSVALFSPEEATMPTRADILHALTEDHQNFLAYYDMLTPEELAQPCTQSGVPEGKPWTPKDHLAHLVLIERTFQSIIKNTLRGDADPVGFSRRGAKNKEEIKVWIDQNNQTYADAHHEDSIETILSDLAATREKTLALLEQLTDEQLASAIPGSHWTDGTIGGLLITNAHHERLHQKWVTEGLQR